MDTALLGEHFVRLFPHAQGERWIQSRAPGRVNLIGEHTDYNDGFVCPMAIDRETVILAAPRGDAVVRIHALATQQTVEFPIDREVPREGPSWALYPKGAVEAMRRRARITRGFDAIVDSTIPLGGGLSSSASFEVATALATLVVNGQTMPREEIALACQWAEHTYPGVPCGIMDQFISTMGRAGHAMLLDCRDRATLHVPLKDPALRIVISNSNVRHELAGGEYAKRRAQCAQAVADLRRQYPRIMALRDATLAHLEEARTAMDPTAFRRAWHVVSETQRALDFARALEQNDYPACGRLMDASHASLRDDYEVSCAELDALVDIAHTVPGVYGARMTGGGFGGCIVALCQASAAEPLAAAIARDYPPRAGGKQATTFSTVASAGATAGELN